MIGTVTGGTIGAYFDNQEKILRKELSNSGVSVERNQNGIKLIMPGNITFATNSSDIRSDFYKILNSISKIFKKYKNTNIIIEGFTDSSGSKQYNQILSEKRAKTVYHYLASQDISEYRIFTYGRGENSPIASNKTKIGKAKNRRVEIKIVPQG